MSETHSHSSGDRAFARDLRRAAPEEFTAYRNFSSTAVGRTDGAVPLKYRELLAVAVALTTQCTYCLETHAANAAQAGVTEEELAETVYITAALRAGGAAAHGMMAMRVFLSAQNSGSVAETGHTHTEETA